MNSSPLVTIICLCYNHEKFVVECLDSVINQSYPNIELIIADDCSSDGSVAVIADWLLKNPTVKFIKNDVNLGNTKTFNKALSLAKGGYIIDLAADDILLPDCVSEQIAKFNSSIYPNLGIVYGNVELVTENGAFISYYFDVDQHQKVTEPRAGGDEYLTILKGGRAAMCPAASMIKKEVYDRLNGYDETLAYEDLDFWIRASRLYNFDFIDKVIFRKRVVSNSLGKQHKLKTDSRSRKINHSTYLVIQKALLLNRIKEEDAALLKRVHYELILNLKNHYFPLVAKYVLLELKIRLKMLLHTY